MEKQRNLHILKKSFFFHENNEFQIYWQFFPPFLMEQFQNLIDNCQTKYKLDFKKYRFKIADITVFWILPQLKISTKFRMVRLLSK